MKLDDVVEQISDLYGSHWMCPHNLEELKILLKQGTECVDALLDAG